MLSPQFLNFPMDLFNADLSGISCLVLVLWVMLALVLVVVRIAAFEWFIEDPACDNNNLVEKTWGMQEGGDDDLKEVICVT